jgi:hypothetical protein
VSLLDDSGRLIGSRSEEYPIHTTSKPWSPWASPWTRCGRWAAGCGARRG